MAPSGPGWRVALSSMELLSSTPISKTYQIDFTNGPRPSRRYFADLAWFERRDNGDGARLHFAQTSLDGNLRSLVTVAVSPHTAGKIIRSSKEAMRAMLAYLERAKVELIELGRRTQRQEPEQAVVIRSNMSAIAQSQHEAVMDFYNASPAEMRDMVPNGYLDIEPVVRVEMSTCLLASLLNAMNEYEGHFPKGDNDA